MHVGRFTKGDIQQFIAILTKKTISFIFKHLLYGRYDNKEGSHSLHVRTLAGPETVAIM